MKLYNQINYYRLKFSIPGLLEFFIFLKMMIYFSVNFFWVDIYSLIEKLVQETKKNLTERNSHPLFTIKISNQAEVKDLGSTAIQPNVKPLIGGSSDDSNGSTVCTQQHQTIQIEKKRLNQWNLSICSNQYKLNSRFIICM
ncbi:MAG: hypothetical protein WD604_13970 [Balneolaceae bacterium]